jgi:phage FluMu protein gp41
MVEIFKTFLEQLKKDEDLIQAKDWEEIMEWMEDEGTSVMFNGRQIRNVVSTAMGIAHADHRSLTRKDLSTVARNTRAFKDALKEQDILYRNKQIKSQ